MTSFVELARREKLQELVKRGVVAYAYRFDRSTTARAALEAFQEDGAGAVHRLAGRILLFRPQGKTTFAHVGDESGKIQLYFNFDVLGSDQYELLRLLDLGDLIGVEGTLFRTRRGEITVRVQRFELLAKSLRPLPLGKEDASGVRHGELADPELRARQRRAVDVGEVLRRCDHARWCRKIERADTGPVFQRDGIALAVDEHRSLGWERDRELRDRAAVRRAPGLDAGRHHLPA